MEQLDLVINLINSAMCGTRITCFVATDLLLERLQEVYKLAKKHDMAHLVAVGLGKNGLLDKGNPIAQKFLQEEIKAVYRYEQLNYELEEISATLENAKISFIPLKGSVLRAYYPESWMRTSCDIDILIHKEDVDKSSQILLEKLNYHLENSGSHDVSFYSPSGVHLELHYTLIEGGILEKVDALLEKVWDFSLPAIDKEYQRTLHGEMFYFYHIAHMAKHFQNGGCGVRPFIDLHVLSERGFLSEATIVLLKEGGLWKFAENANALTEVWFGNGAHTQITKQMENYILNGGVYGNTENRVAAQQVKKGGKCKYLCTRIFMPYDELKFKYPILQKHKWLTPIMEVRRWFNLLKPSALKRSLHEAKSTANVTKEGTESMRVLLMELGLE